MLIYLVITAIDSNNLNSIGLTIVAVSAPWSFDELDVQCMADDG